MTLFSIEGVPFLDALDQVEFDGVQHFDARPVTQLGSSLRDAGVSRVDPVGHALDLDGRGHIRRVVALVHEPIAFPVLQNERLAGPLVTRHQVQRQIVDLGRLARCERPAERRARRRRLRPRIGREAQHHQDVRGEGHREELLEVRRPCKIGERGDAAAEALAGVVA
ncbi:MAG TPA: hypothetical protein VFB54_03280, partial [Burkholderiales bacterium]|nr:hypothetical protein [Burkholderiales bacterium]